MKRLTLSLILLIFLLGAYGQNLIGYSARDIINYMKDKEKEMNYNTVRNSRYKYLKYTDNSDNNTTLFFLNSDSVCHSIRMICDLSGKSEKLKKFNAIYKKGGENIWIDNRAGKNYLVEIRDEQWSCVITIEPEKSLK